MMVEAKQEINQNETIFANTKTRQPQRGSHLVTFSHAHVMTLLHNLKLFILSFTLLRCQTGTWMQSLVYCVYDGN